MIRRQRRADDGLVEGGQEDRDHDRAEDAHADGVGELDGRPILRAAPGLCRCAGHQEHLTARLLWTFVQSGGQLGRFRA